MGDAKSDSDNNNIIRSGPNHSNSQNPVFSKLTHELTKASSNITKAFQYASKPFSDSDDLSDEDQNLTEEERKKQVQAVHGSLANLLPLSDENKLDSIKEDKSVPTEDTQKSTPVKTTPSGLFHRVASKAAGELFTNGPDSPSEKKKPLTPGEIRLKVLEWMYEERDDTCVELNLKNLTILTDLIPPFVSVVLHGKSEAIRSSVWSFLLKSSATSAHFAFLVICSLNSNKKVDDRENELMQLHHREDANEIEKVVNEKMSTIKKDFEDLKYTLGEKSANLVERISAEIESTIKQLESVHHKHLLRTIDQGPTSRKNIEFLIERVRRFARNVPNNKLDGKIGFIKALTDLDEWLIRSLPRDQRLEALKKKLRGLSHSLPLGAYLPVHEISEHRVLKLVVDETIVFNTAHKCPFLLVAEIETEGESSRKELDYFESSDLEEDDEQSEYSLTTYHQGIELVPSEQTSWNGESKVTSVPENDDERIDDSNESCKYEDVQEVLLSSEPNAVSGSENSVQMESWEEMVERIRQKSEYGNRSNWKLAAMFVKSADDLRQQQLGVLVVSMFQKVFWEEKVPVWIAPYKVLATGPSSGLLEPARNADSIARIKEREGCKGIDEYFLQKFGPRDTSSFKVAQRNFMISLAGYSVIAYLIKLHDRHNGNILIDTEGHLLHIDFGFMLGYSHKLERSPFKLTKDMVSVLGGPRSYIFQKFRRLMEKAFIAANKHHKELVLLVELMSVGSTSPCFAGGRRWVIDELRERFKPGYSKRKLKLFVNDIIDSSLGNMTSRCYDSYQRCVNGIF